MTEYKRMQGNVIEHKRTISIQANLELTFTMRAPAGEAFKRGRSVSVQFLVPW